MRISRSLGRESVPQNSICRYNETTVRVLTFSNQNTKRSATFFFLSLCFLKLARLSVHRKCRKTRKYFRFEIK